MKDTSKNYFREVYEKTETTEVYCVTNIDEFCSRLLKDNLLEN